MKKTCTSCGQAKSPAEFYKDKKGSDGLRAKCKDCHRIAMRQYWESVKNKPEHKARVSEWNRRHYRKRREHYIQAHKKYNASPAGKAAHKRYRQGLRGKMLTAKVNVRYRTGKRCLFPLTAIQWTRTLAIFNHRCAYCQTDTSKLTQDHVIPLTAGGQHMMGNVVPACQSCNSRKQNKNHRKWMAQEGLVWEHLEAALARLQ